MTETEQRQRVIAEAKTWLGTPYHHHAAVKGAGVDCAQILIEVYADAGLTERVDVGAYPIDWASHRSEERYISWVEKYAKRVDTPQPGDIAMWRFGRCFSHAAIVVDWPVIIHSVMRDGMVVIADGTKGELATRDVLFYSLWAK